MTRVLITGLALILGAIWGLMLVRSLREAPCPSCGRSICACSDRWRSR